MTFDFNDIHLPFRLGYTGPFVNLRKSDKVHSVADECIHHVQ